MAVCFQPAQNLSSGISSALFLRFQAMTKGKVNIFMMYRRQLWLIWLTCTLALFIFNPDLRAQKSYSLKFQSADSAEINFHQFGITKTDFKDSVLLVEELTLLQRILRNKAYLEASLDSIVWRDSTAEVFIHLGPQYSWLTLENGNLPEAYVRRAAFISRRFEKQRFNLRQLISLQENLLQLAEDDGYPFASIEIDSIRIRNGEVSGAIFMNPGRMVTFDSLSVEGDAGISAIFLRSYLGIKNGEPYNRSRILKISSRLRAIPFVTETRTASVTFWENLASVNLFLDRRKASRFDFLLGVQPDSRRETNRLILTGTFLAALQNQLGIGEQFMVAFERLRPQTQKLEISAELPYLLNFPFGFEGAFYQYRRDSSYTDIKGRAGLQYIFEGGTYLKAFSRSEASNLIGVDTQALLNGVTPAQLDVKTTFYGIEGSLQRLDYRLNPRNGWTILVSAGLGLRKIRKNQAILNAIPEFYDTLQGKSLQAKIEWNARRYFPVFSRSTVVISFDGAVLTGGKPLYKNELFRIGGNTLLRGFDEESILANSYIVFTLEYRLLAGQNSYFYAFGDYAYLQERTAELGTGTQRMLGIGAGMTFETTAGVFAVGVAVGKTQDIALDFRNPKVHFGYVTYF